MATLTTISETVASRPKPEARERQLLRLSAVTWDDYEKYQELFDHQRGFRLAYDRGVLEILSPTLAHDGDSRFLGDLVRSATMILALPARRGGSTTMRSALIDRGIEPDDCFWIENAARMAGRRELDLTIDPPPDLAIEVHVTRSSLNRFAIYAAFGVGELWRLDKDRLTFHLLQDDETYSVSARSGIFPQIDADGLMNFFVAARTAVNQNTVIHEFEEWLRAHSTLSS